ncbi:unnamed protein product, partial [Prorocentrum cordatum]
QQPQEQRRLPRGGLGQEPEDRAAPARAEGIAQDAEALAHRDLPLGCRQQGIHSHHDPPHNLRPHRRRHSPDGD